MPRQKKLHPAGEAARLLGVSLDTLRRWDNKGTIRTTRDERGRRLVPASEIARLKKAAPETSMSARNRLRGVVHEVKVEGLLAQVEIHITEPARVVAVITREAVEELGLKPGMDAVAVVKATSVMVER
jgi:molybdopterin-binding protein